MKPPIFVRELSEKERERLKAGLRSRETFVMRRCQILLASAGGLSPPKIAANLGCASQTVRNAIRAFNERGREALTPGSPFTTRETVLMLTSAAVATSRMVGLATLADASPR